MTDAVVIVDNLFKTFGRTKALDGLSLRIHQGEKYGLLGPNGSGKTTLIRSLVGLVLPEKGEVTVLGQKVPAPEVSTRIGYMTQAPALYEDLTVRENLRFFGRLFGGGADLGRRTEEMLGLVDMTDRGGSPVRTLSGGMRQRVSLAVALIHQPELMLLDEPTVGVDPELRLALWRHFDRLNAEGKTFIVSTHVMEEAEHCTRVGLMQAGRFLAEGSPRELKERAGASTLEQAYLWFAKEGGRHDA